MTFKDPVSVKNNSDHAVNCKIKTGNKLLRPAIVSSSCDFSSKVSAAQIQNQSFDSQNMLRSKIPSVEFNKIVMEESLMQMEETMREM